jgi:hypothetical protein
MKEKPNLKYVEAVFASGGKFGYLTDAPEWDDFFSLLNKDVWRPPHRAAVSSKYVNIVYNKLVADVNAVLAASSGEWLQFDGWTDPNVEQVFNIMFGATLPIYITSFIIAGFSEIAEKLVSSIKDVMAKFLPPISMMSADPASWTEAKNIGIVRESPSVMSKTRATMLDDDMFVFAYECSSHAMSNLCRDVLKLPKALSALSLATKMAKYFSNRNLPREHLRVERDKLSPKPPTLKLYAQTRWTGAATLLSTVLQNREAITTVFFKANQKVIDMDFDNTFLRQQ